MAGCKLYGRTRTSFWDGIFVGSKTTSESSLETTTVARIIETWTYIARKALIVNLHSMYKEAIPVYLLLLSLKII